MTPAQWATFLGIAFVVIATPGPDTALTVRNSLQGRRAGSFTALGVVTGQLVWTLGASTGVSALLVASEGAFRALRVAGAVYLVYLGVASLISAWRTGRKLEQTDAPQPHLTGSSAYRQGLISNLGNPKAAVFFTSLLPQFASPGAGTFGLMLLLGCVFALITLIWLNLYAFAIDKAGDVFRRSRVSRVLEAVMGCVLIGLGVRLARTSK